MPSTPYPRHSLTKDSGLQGVRTLYAVLRLIELQEQVVCKLETCDSVARPSNARHGPNQILPDTSGQFKFSSLVAGGHVNKIGDMSTRLAGVRHAVGKKTQWLLPHDVAGCLACFSIYSSKLLRQRCKPWSKSLKKELMQLHRGVGLAVCPFGSLCVSSSA